MTAVEVNESSAINKLIGAHVCFDTMKKEIHDGLDLSGDDDGGYPFGIFSVKFSTDGRELVAGTSDDSIYVYDLEANKLSLRILAHTTMAMATLFHLPITAAQVGTYFVGQYYQVLQHQPKFVHQFYSDASTMIHIDGNTRVTATAMLQIHTLVMSLYYTGIEIKTAHSLES
ncbi:hypothetical protein U1Q18_042471 [Sarracenia purpurea var. burkii]